VLTTKVEQQATERDATANRVEQLEQQVADLIQMNLQLKASNADKDERLAASVGGASHFRLSVGPPCHVVVMSALQNMVVFIWMTLAGIVIHRQRH
jgi:hypothetical protein